MFIYNSHWAQSNTPWGVSTGERIYFLKYIFFISTCQGTLQNSKHELQWCSRILQVVMCRYKLRIVCQSILVEKMRFACDTFLGLQCLIAVFTFLSNLNGVFVKVGYNNRYFFPFKHYFIISFLNLFSDIIFLIYLL